MGIDDDLAALRAEVGRLTARVAELEGEREQPALERQGTRRDLLRLGGLAVAGGIGAALAGGEPAAAANGEAVTIGQTKEGTTTTTVQAQAGYSGAVTSLVTFDATTNSNPNSINALFAKGSGTRAGVSTIGGGTSGPGVFTTGGLPNGVGVNAHGTGTGAAVRAAADGTGPGVLAFGGTEAAGVDATGGSGGGPGVVGSAIVGDNNGVVGIGSGAAAGTYGQGGVQNGPGVLGEGGGTDGAGVRGVGIGNGVGVHGEGGNVGDGVVGFSGANAGQGVRALGKSSGCGVLAENSSTGPAIGILTSGTGPHIMFVTNGTPGPPQGATNVFKGSLRVDSAGTWWVCSNDSVGGGGWERVTRVRENHAGGALNFLFSPIRIVDTRGSAVPGTITNGGQRLVAGVDKQFQVVGTTIGGISVPSGATGAFGTITCDAPLGGGFFGMFPADVTWPGTSNLNYTNAPIATSFTVALSAGGALKVRCGSNAAHCIIDIAGFVA